ncbi:MAG TPA: hypothetical protein VLX68_00950 [Chitinivibrionales bacterium]|nr:hypothetical protein [Chitinivibrionales bacterium]
MNAIFTIAAKNYLAQAKTLADSAAKYCPEFNFFIVLADEAENSIALSSEKHSIIEAKDFEIPKIMQMAFKYDVVEFCTSVKPFIFDHLFKQYKYDHIFYLDPDTIICSSLADALEALKNNFLLLTPHFMNPYVSFEGSTSEEELLFVGIFNLGFAAIRRCLESQQFLTWWKEKLKDQCFADKQDALHVDQRWMDFVPVLYEKGAKIFRHPGYNVATWNLHERNVAIVNDRYTVDYKFPLVVYHFSGFDPNDPNSMCKKQSKYNLVNYPQFKPLFDEYRRNLIRNGYHELSKLPYAYNKFNNGISIVRFQRRLFRALLKDGYNVQDPFSTSPGSYYDMLEKNKLIIHEKGKNLDQTRKIIPNYKQKMNRMFKTMLLLKKIIGIRRYYYLMRFFLFYTRFEEQLFLIEKRT